MDENNVNTIMMNATEISPLDEFRIEILNIHNRIRKKHDASVLELSNELCDEAQSWAEKLAKKGHLSFREFQGIGENITFFPLSVDAEAIVNHWYTEHLKYEYEAPGWQAGTNYFTQIIWRSTKEIGIGRAIIHRNETNGFVSVISDEDNNEQIIVAFYRPEGNNNRNGQYAANVRKPLGVESFE